MANQYFNHTNPARDGTKVASAQYNNTLLGVQAGFDLLPTPTQFYYDNARYGAATSVTTNIYQLALPAISASFGYVVGMGIQFTVPVPNTGPAQISVNGLGVKELRTPVGETLMSGDLALGVIYDARYDGTYFQVTNTIDSALKLQTDGALYINNFGNTTVGGVTILAYTGAGLINVGQSVAGTSLLQSNFAGANLGAIPSASIWVALGSATGSASVTPTRVTLFARSS